MLQYIVGGLRTALQSVTSQIFLFRVPFDCTLKGIDVSIGASVPSGGLPATFNVRAGADPASLLTVFASPSDRPSVTAGNSSASLSGLSLALARGWLVIDLDSLPSGGVAAPVFVSLTVDDGVNVSLTVQEADGSPSFAATTLQVGNGDLTQPTTGVARIKTAADALAQLLTGGKIDPTLLPGLAITDKFIAASDAAMTALAAQQGDVCFRTDLSEVYLLAGTDPTVLSNWVQWLHPAIPTTLPPSGSAGGDLGGSYPNPSVNQIKGRSVGGIPNVPGFLSDDFNDNSFDTSIWTRDNSASTARVLEQNHRLELSSRSGIDGRIGVHSVTSDFHNHAVSFSLSGVAGVSGDGATYGTSWSFYVALMNSPGVVNDIVFGSYSSVAFFIYGSGGSYHLKGHHYRLGTAYDTVFNIVYDPVAHKFMRFRHDSPGTTMYFETSPDGSTWTVQGTCATNTTASVNLSSARLIVFADDGVTGYFDDFTSDIPQSDPIAASDGFALTWDQLNNQFSLVQILARLLKAVDGNPSGAPSGHVAGSLEVQYDRVNHRLNVWNDNSSHWDSINLPDTF